MSTPDQEDRQSYGPAMLACTPKERLFVEQVMEGKPFADAARVTGFGNEDGTSSANTLARIGYRLSHRDRVIGAIAEEAKKMVRTAVPSAVKAVKEIVTSPFHKDRARVALALIEKVDPTVQRQEVEVTHKIDHEDEALQQLRTLRALNVAQEKLIELYGAFGLERLERKLMLENKSKTIDAEFTEVRDPDAVLLGE
jgi:phage terminase small subunit